MQDQHDERLDAGLSAIGSDLPMAALSDAARARVEQVVEQACAPRRAVRSFRGAFAAATAVAAVCAIAAGAMFVEAGHARTQRDALLAQSESFTVGDLPRYIAVNMDHNNCPVAEKVTPEFDKIRRQFAGEPMMFITLDLSTPEQQKLARHWAEEIGIDFIFDQFKTTGQLFLVDRMEREIIDTEIGRESVPKFEAELQTVSLRRP